jgi:protocatechuate 3,4-dioxygenase beta subunit
VRADHPARLDSSPTRLQLIEGETLTGVDLVLESGRAIKGRVRDVNGNPASGVPVVAAFDLARVSGPDFFNAMRGARSSTETDVEGNFTLGGLGAGPFVVEADLQRGVDASNERLRWSARLDGILPGGQPLELVLRPPLYLAGQVLDEEGRPVPSFSVIARQEVMGDFAATTVAYHRGAFTHDGGRFVLTGLEAGQWQVTVEGLGLVSTQPVTVDLPGDGAHELRMTVVRAATVSGEVLDPDGEPVVGALVRVDEGSVGWQVQQDPFPDDLSTSTDEAGVFHLVGIPPGAVGLRADAAGYGVSATTRVDLEPAEVHEDLVLTLTVGGSLTGEVFDGEGRPARGFLILAFNMADFTQEVGLTQADGTFRIEHMPPGGWMAVAMDPAAEMEITEKGLDFGAMMGQWKMTQATIREGQTTHVVIGAPFENSVLVSGEVTLGDEPYTGALLSFVPPGGRMYEEMVNGTVAPDGSYSVELGATGDYIVSVQVVSSAAGQQNSIEFAVEIPDGVEQFELDFRLPLGRISGRVIGPDREPAPGARVTLTYDGVVRSDSFFGGQYTEMTTQADGTFDVTALRPGRYRLSAGGASAFSGALQTPYGRVTTGDLKLGQDQWMQGVELRLPRPGSIVVTVLGPGGQPVPKASVFVRDAGGRMLEPFSMVVTDGAGRCDYSGVAPGEVTVSARGGPLTCEESESVSVNEGRQTAVTLRLEPGTILLVVLRDKQGKPTSAAVSVTDESGREMTGMFGMADLQALYMDGQFSPTEHRLGPLAPGRYTVSAVINGQVVTKKVRLKGEAQERLALRAR